ncbi:unnamed protein product [Effrenium voratum]|nr:unnamed protein product [Effrenium voratum]
MGQSRACVHVSGGGVGGAGAAVSLRLRRGPHAHGLSGASVGVPPESGHGGYQGDYAYLYATPRGFGFLTLSQLSQGLRLDPEADVTLQEQTPPPFVAWCPEGQKHLCTAKIVEWYRARDVPILDEDVYFFDDKEDNVRPFTGTSYNALQVSCGTRGNGTRGLCGGTLQEAQPAKGVFLCHGAAQVCAQEIYLCQEKGTIPLEAWENLVSPAGSGPQALDMFKQAPSGIMERILQHHRGDIQVGHLRRQDQLPEDVREAARKSVTPQAYEPLVMDPWMLAFPFDDPQLAQRKYEFCRANSRWKQEKRALALKQKLLLKFLSGDALQKAKDQMRKGPAEQELEAEQEKKKLRDREQMIAKLLAFWHRRMKMLEDEHEGEKEQFRFKVRALLEDIRSLAQVLEGAALAKKRRRRVDADDLLRLRQQKAEEAARHQVEEREKQANFQALMAARDGDADQITSLQQLAAAVRSGEEGEKAARKERKRLAELLQMTFLKQRKPGSKDEPKSEARSDGTSSSSSSEAPPLRVTPANNFPPPMAPSLEVPPGVARRSSLQLRRLSTSPGRASPRCTGADAERGESGAAGGHGGGAGAKEEPQPQQRHRRAEGEIAAPEGHRQEEAQCRPEGLHLRQPGGVLEAHDWRPEHGGNPSAEAGRVEGAEGRVLPGLGEGSAGEKRERPATKWPSAAGLSARRPQAPQAPQALRARSAVRCVVCCIPGPSRLLLWCKIGGLRASSLLGPRCPVLLGPRCLDLLGPPFLAGWCPCICQKARATAGAAAKSSRKIGKTRTSFGRRCS